MKNIIYRVFIIFFIVNNLFNVRLNAQGYQIDFDVISPTNNKYKNINIDIRNINTGAVSNIVANTVDQDYSAGAIITGGSGSINLEWGQYQIVVNSFIKYGYGFFGIYWQDQLADAIKKATINLCNSDGLYHEIIFPEDSNFPNNPLNTFFRYRITKNTPVPDPCNIDVKVKHEYYIPSTSNLNENNVGRYGTFDFKSLERGINAFHLNNFDNGASGNFDYTYSGETLPLSYKQFSSYDYLSSYTRGGYWGNGIYTYVVTDDYPDASLLCSGGERRRNKFNSPINKLLTFNSTYNQFIYGCTAFGVNVRQYYSHNYKIIPVINNLQTFNTYSSQNPEARCANKFIHLKAPAGINKLTQNYKWEYKIEGNNFFSSLAATNGNDNPYCYASDLSNYTMGRYVYFRMNFDNGQAYTNETAGFRFLPLPPTLTPEIVQARCGAIAGGQSYCDSITLSTPLLTRINAANVTEYEKIVLNGRVIGCGTGPNNPNNTCFSVTGGDLIIRADYLVPGTIKTYYFKKASKVNDPIYNGLYDRIQLPSGYSYLYYLADLFGNINTPFNPNNSEAGDVQAIINANMMRTCAADSIPVNGVFPPAPKMDSTAIVKTNIDCYNTNTGSINTTNAYKILSGNSASWRPAVYFIGKVNPPVYDANNNTGIFNGLPAGTYKAWFTTAYNCKSDTTIYIAIDSPQYALNIGSDFTQKDEISSINLTDGNLSLNVPANQSGWGNLKYQWKKNGAILNGQTTNTITNLSEGLYTFIVKDNNGVAPFCTKELSYNLLKPDSLKVDSIKITQSPNCYETNEGKIKFYFSGSMPRTSPSNQFSYKIFDRVTGLLVREKIMIVNLGTYQTNKKASDTINSFYKGLYKLVLNYKNVEYDSANFSITAPDSIKAVVTELIDANGAGVEGSVKINVTGGTGPYRYKWVDSSEILMPNDSNIIRRNLMLSNDNNSNLLIPNTNPEEYLPYTIEVKNSNTTLGCKIATISNIYINRDKPVITLTQLKYANPNVSDGAVAVKVTRGKLPYVNIKWVRVGNTDTVIHNFINVDTLHNISSGNYYAEVQDSSGFIVNTIIYLPVVIKGTITQIQPIRCFNNYEAQLNVTPSGGDSTGTPIYGYQWLDSAQQIIQGQQTNSINLLPAGKYFVKITDKRDSSFIAGPYTITQPPLFKITGETIQTPTCNNSTDGFIKVNFTGGTAPYTFKWNGFAADSAVIRNIGIGQYTIRIKDSLGCPLAPGGEISKLYNITSQSDIRILDSLTTIITPTTDVSTDGSVALVIKDYQHANGYTLNYIWKNDVGTIVAQGTTTPNANGLVNINLTNKPSGEYFLKINSTYGCTLERSYVLIGPNQIIVKIYASGIDSVKCYQKADAKIKPVIYKGANIGALNIKWTKLINASQQFITADTILNQVGAGNYTITVKGFSPALPDSIISSANAVLFDQPKIMVQFTGIINEHCDKKDGVIFSDTYGGRSNGPYRYTWTRLSGREGFALIDSNKKILDSLSEGKYRLYAIENAYGCKDSNDVVINNTFINVTTNFVAPICAGGTDGKIQIIPTGGKEVSDFYFYKLAKLNTTTNGYDTIQNTYNLSSVWFNNLSKGKYKIIVTTKYGCKEIADVDLPDPVKFSINIGDDKTLCVSSIHVMSPIFSSSDGAIVDTAGWKYQWYHFPDNLNSIYNAYSLNQHFIAGAKKPTLQINEVELINGKRYLLKATTDKQCILLDSIKFERSNQKLLASFLVSEQAFTNEAIVAINTSSIAPYIQWILPASCTIVPNPTNDTGYITFKFAQPGVYPIKFRAYNKNVSGIITCETLLLSNITVTEPLVANANTTRLPSIFKIGYPKIIPNPIMGNQLNVSAQVHFNEKARVYIVEMGTTFKIDLPDWNLVKGITNTYSQPISGVLVSKQYALVLETPKERKVLPFLKL
jgi:SprB repeat